MLRRKNVIVWKLHEEKAWSIKLYSKELIFNFRIAKNSRNIFLAYWKYFFIRHSSEYETSNNSQNLAIIRRFILWKVSDAKVLSVCWKYASAILCYSNDIQLNELWGGGGGLFTIEYHIQKQFTNKLLSTLHKLVSWRTYLTYTKKTLLPENFAKWTGILVILGRF